MPKGCHKWFKQKTSIITFYYYDVYVRIIMNTAHTSNMITELIVRYVDHHLGTAPFFSQASVRVWIKIKRKHAKKMIRNTQMQILEAFFSRTCTLNAS